MTDDDEEALSDLALNYLSDKFPATTGQAISATTEFLRARLA